MKLKPCPFCGGDALNGFAGGKHNGVHSVSCTSCGACVGVCILTSKDGVTTRYSAEEQAVNAWNRRTHVEVE